MNSSVFNRLKGYFQAPHQWFWGTAERALDQAYQAALRIKAIEDEQFEGQRITTDSSRHSASVLAYFQSELKKNLSTARLRLAEFRASHSVLNSNNGNSNNANSNNGDRANLNGTSLAFGDRSEVILEKLRFIDQVIERYNPPKRPLPIPRPNSSPTALVTKDSSPLAPGRVQSNFGGEKRYPEKADLMTDVEAITDKTGVLPRSILGTVNRIKKELNPRAEEDVVRDFRTSKAKTIISLRFFLLLILIPLLVQQISKNFVVGPIVDHVRQPTPTTLFLNEEMEESAFRELHIFEERLRFESLLTNSEQMTPEVMETRLHEKVNEIAQDFYQQSGTAVKNIFADIFALAAFAVVIFTNKREIEILKNFLGEIVYGLSDSAKAFIIILLTDVFVGFHSPHGWEVLLEGAARHLGLPANRDFIFLFIATFPVILDTVFKYWIFRYLNRISPSAVATYRNMNE